MHTRLPDPPASFADLIALAYRDPSQGLGELFRSSRTVSEMLSSTDVSFCPRSATLRDYLSWTVTLITRPSC